MECAAGGCLAGSVGIRFPVAGTPIVHSALYGAWTIEATVDDSTAPCGPPADFRLVN